MSHLLLLMAGLGATHHHASPTHHKARATWAECVSFAGCAWHDMPKAPRRPTGHWTRCTAESGLTVCVEYPQFRPKPMRRAVLPVKATSRAAVTAPVGRTVVTYYLFTTYYCLTGETASGRMAGPGIVASYILPWGAHVRDTYTGWEGYVWDHPDMITQADEWLPCGQNFPTGVHKWEVIP